jgi:hypothetical protein
MNQTKELKDLDQRKPLTEDQKDAIDRINSHLESIKEEINEHWDYKDLEEWLRLNGDHNHRSNGNQFKEDIEPRVKRLWVE